MRHDRGTVRTRILSAIRALMLAGAGLLGGAASAAPEFTTEFELDECTFTNVGRNPHFSIQPGDRLVLEGTDDGDVVRVQITVLNQTRQITFTDEGEPVSVSTRVVEEKEWINGEIVEISRNFYARCTETGDIFYFGEDVDIYENGVIVSHDGAWRAGQQGARPGLIMPGRFLLGSKYFQEQAPNAQDRAEHTRMTLTIRTPAGTFRECVEVVETTPLEPGTTSVKRYCPEIGLVVDGKIRLVEFAVAGADAGGD
jgi:hypothetical protein